MIKKWITDREYDFEVNKILGVIFECFMNYLDEKEDSEIARKLIK